MNEKEIQDKVQDLRGSLSKVNSLVGVLADEQVEVVMQRTDAFTKSDQMFSKIVILSVSKRTEYCK